MMETVLKFSADDRNACSRWWRQDQWRDCVAMQAFDDASGTAHDGWLDGWKGVAGRDGAVLMAGDGPGGGDESGDDDQGGLATATARPQVKPPPMYKVLLMNDDYTPMEFVVHVLEKFFGMNGEKATQVMLAVHTTGAGVCGIYARDVAETKAAQVVQYAQEHQHPLMSKVEMTD